MRFFSVILSSIIIGFLFCSAASAQKAEKDSLQLIINSLNDNEEKVEQLMSLAMLYEQTNPDSMIILMEEANAVANNIDNEALILETKINVGRTYIRKGFYTKALTELRDALDYLNNTAEADYELFRAQILRSLGNIYFIQYQHDEAINFYEEARPIYEASDDSAGLSSLYDNIASVYLETKEWELSEHYYFKSIEVAAAMGNTVGVSRTYLNLGILYDSQDELDKAIYYNELALEMAIETNAMIMQTYLLKTLSSVSRKRGEFNEAISYAKRSLEIASEMGIIYEMKDAYANLSVSYEGLGDYKMAYEFYTLEKELNDSLLNEQAATELAELRAEYETEKQQQEILFLEQENELKSARIISVTIAFCAIILTMVFISIWYMARKRREIQLLEKDKIIADSQKKLAQEELNTAHLREENLQKELTNYALHIVEKNDFLEEVKHEMATIRNDVKNSEALSQINKLGSKIYQNLMINKDREEFEIQVEQACEGFFKNLERNFPSLTNQDRRLSGLLRLNLSSKEISGILNISPKSVDQSRYRLRKKLGLSKESNLATFFNQL